MDPFVIRFEVLYYNNISENDDREKYQDIKKILYLKIIILEINNNIINDKKKLLKYLYNINYNIDNNYFRSGELLEIKEKIIKKIKEIN